MTTLAIHGATDRGMARGHNEDAFVSCPDIHSNQWAINQIQELQRGKDSVGILAVADGMGGTQAGEVASAIATERLKHHFQDIAESSMPKREEDIPTLLEMIFQDIHQEIAKTGKANSEQAGMGTTLCLVLTYQGKAHVMWSGDSRLYRYVPVAYGADETPQYELELVTQDHSMVWELVTSGQISPEEARLHPNSNIITQSLGEPGSPPRPDYTSFQLVKGEYLILCSDGLNSMLADQEIAAILAESRQAGLAELTQYLIAAANGSGGKDNITVLAAKVEESELLLKTETGDYTASTTQKSAKNYSRMTVLALLAVALVALAFNFEAAANWVSTSEQTEEEKNVDDSTSTERETSSQISEGENIEQEKPREEKPELSVSPPSSPSRPTPSRKQEAYNAYTERLRGLMERKHQMYKALDALYDSEVGGYYDCAEKEGFYMDLRYDINAITKKNDDGLYVIDQAKPKNEIEYTLDFIAQQLDHNNQKIEELENLGIAPNCDTGNTHFSN